MDLCLKGTAEKLIDQLKVDSDGVDTYVEDFLLTYRTFVKSTRDITSRLLEWCSDYKLRDKVFGHRYFRNRIRVVLKINRIIKCFYASVQHNVAGCMLYWSCSFVRPCVRAETLTWYLAEYSTHFH